MSYTSLRIDEDLLDDVRRLAQSEDRTVASVIRRAVRSYVVGHSDEDDSQERRERPRAAA